MLNLAALAQEQVSATAVAIAQIFPQQVREDPLSALRILHLKHPCDRARAMADFARVLGPQPENNTLLAAAEDMIGNSRSAPRPTRLRSRDEPVSLLVAHAAAYVAEVAAEVGEKAVAAQVATMALENCEGMGEADTQADAWARVARAFESMGDIDHTDELLEKIERMEPSDEDIVVIGNSITALVRCAQVARTPQRAWSLLMRADRAAHHQSDKQPRLTDAREDLVAAVAAFGDPPSLNRSSPG